MYIYSHRLAVQEVLSAALDMLSDVLQRLAQAAHTTAPRMCQYLYFCTIFFFVCTPHAFRCSATPCSGCAPPLLSAVSICTFVPDFFFLHKIRTPARNCAATSAGVSICTFVPVFVPVCVLVYLCHVILRSSFAGNH